MGCKVSQYDGERLAELLRQLGLIQTENNPELFILNGCSVTGRASQKVRQLLRATRKRWPAVKIVLAGCEARLIAKRNEEAVDADWLLPENTPAAVTKMLAALSLDIRPDFAGERAMPVSSRTRAFLKIQDGCSQFCSYCIVAHLRGPEWSRPIDDAILEAGRLVAEGHQELVLTGIHIGHFRPALVDLLQRLEQIDGLKRIRISSIEPIEVDASLLAWVASSAKACRHFHLPLQSGCDKILKAMRRPYTTCEFRNVVAEIRSRMPLAAITTDLIVGFPGETREDFAQPLQFLKEMNFSRIHIFKFSPRDGTPAATMPDQIDNSCKAMRSDLVEKIWKESASSFHERFVGQTLEVLWETLENGYLHGFSREYVPCLLPASDDRFLNRIQLVTGLQLQNEGLLVEATP